MLSSVEIEQMTKLYLNDQLQPGHPHYEEISARMKDTPDGKRIEKFHEENEAARDGLQFLTVMQLDNLIRASDIPFNGDPFDRIGKIRAVRAAQTKKEKALFATMTKEEIKMYLQEKRSKPNRQEQINDVQGHEERKLRIDERKAIFYEKRIRMMEEREKQRAEGRAYLDAESARREKPQKKEEQEQSTVTGSDERKVQLLAMKVTGLNAIMKQNELPMHAGMKNAEKVEVILAHEFQSVVQP